MASPVWWTTRSGRLTAPTAASASGTDRLSRRAPWLPPSTSTDRGICVSGVSRRSIRSRRTGLPTTRATEDEKYPALASKVR